MGHTQKALADKISKELGLPLQIGRRFLQRTLDLIADDIVYTGESKFRGLGTFSVFTYPPKETTHPITGEPIYIPKKKVAKFRSSVVIRRRLNPKRIKIKKAKKKSKR